MSVTIHCPHCGAAGNAPDHIIGQSVRCSKCKQSFVAGGEDEPEDAPDERDESEEDFDVPPPPRKGKARARSGGGGGGESGFGDILMFRTLVGPTIVVIVFWLAVVGMILGTLGMIGMSFMFGAMAGLGALVAGVFQIIIGIPMIRLFCELMLVQFRIYEKLKEMKGPPP
jgi:hypothetical protein